MANADQKVEHAGVMLQFCTNHIACDHWSITVHAFIHQNCMATSWQKRNKSDIIWLYILHIYSKCFRNSLLCPCTAHSPSMAVQVTTSWDGIMLNTFAILQKSYSLWSQGILLKTFHTLSSTYTSTFCMHVNKLLPKKTSDSKPLLIICSWTYWHSSSITTLAHAFSTLTKVTGSSHTSSCCICWNSCSAFWPCPHFRCPKIMAFQLNTSLDGILLNSLQASLMLPHFAYLSTKLLPTKTSDSQPF